MGGGGGREGGNEPELPRPTPIHGYIGALHWPLIAGPAGCPGREKNKPQRLTQLIGQ